MSKSLLLVAALSIPPATIFADDDESSGAPPRGFFECPPDVTIECFDVTDPSNTGSPSCNGDLSFFDSITGRCPTTITRTWTCTVRLQKILECDQFS